jgi:hypothetical protein
MRGRRGKSAAHITSFVNDGEKLSWTLYFHNRGQIVREVEGSSSEPNSERDDIPLVTLPRFIIPDIDDSDNGELPASQIMPAAPPWSSSPMESLSLTQTLADGSVSNTYDDFGVRF